MKESRSQPDPHERLPARAGRILVVEDSRALRRGIATALRDAGSDVSEASDGASAIALISNPEVACFDVIVTDQRLPGADGVAVLRAARCREPRTGVILMTAFGTVETAVEAMQLGAVDFIEKPFELEHIEFRVQRALAHGRLLGEVQELRNHRGSGLGAEAVIAESSAMQEAVALAKQVASIRSTILISGETGTGKEVIANLIHSHSNRASGPFVKVNCAALPETLLESELFGHERGAFTGADQQRVGRFEEASGGTLMLDEIADTAPTTQAKLLRVLQEQEFHRLGGTRPLRTDARIIAATNRDLRGGGDENPFREDLYFRLNVIEIHLAPLRERPEDVRALAENYLQCFREDLGQEVSGFSAAAIERIAAHRWPGNVRELRNCIERAVLLAPGPEIAAEDLAIDDGLPAHRAGGWKLELPPEGVFLDEVEQELVEAALRRTGYVQKDAADLLHVSRRKLNYMIQKMGITHSSWRRNRARPESEESGED